MDNAYHFVSHWRVEATCGEVADLLGVTDRTVRRDWEKARLLLAEMLR